MSTTTKCPECGAPAVRDAYPHTRAANPSYRYAPPSSPDTRDSERKAAASRDEIRMLEKVAEHMGDDYYRPALYALAERLEAGANPDTERLDWIQREQALTHPTWNEGVKSFGFGINHRHFGLTLREAIDAAMQATPTGDGK